MATANDHTAASADQIAKLNFDSGCLTAALKFRYTVTLCQTVFDVVASWQEEKGGRIEFIRTEQFVCDFVCVCLMQLVLGFFLTFLIF